MRFVLWTFFLFLGLASAHSQELISGLVTDKKSNPIIGANLFVEGSYDGGVSDQHGRFSFHTEEKGEIILQISYLGYETERLKRNVGELGQVHIKLRESALALDAVEVSASTFKAGEQSKLAVLNALDIVTTAGSNGDVIAAIQTLPGTQANPDDGRLFVRGGNAQETNIYIDGLKVFSPYTRTIGGTPSRGRYSPFLFKGVNFSTGAYSAEYGQALSGILNMKSLDEPRNTATNVSIMTVGLGLGHTRKWEESSLSFNASYIDLEPYNWFVPNRIDFIDPFHGFSGEAIFRAKTKKGMLKTYIAGDQGGFKLIDENIDCQCDEAIEITNDNIYFNSTYTQFLNDKHSLFTGVSLGQNKDALRVNDSIQIDNDLLGLHARMALKSIINDHFILNSGVELLLETHQFEQSQNDSNNPIKAEIKDRIPAAFVETDYFFSKYLAVKIGARAEHSNELGEVFFSPRITIAQKLGENAQVSGAYGVFYQGTNVQYRYFENELDHEKAEHAVVNYNYKTRKNILRLEAYYKKYSELVKFSGTSNDPLNLNNLGDGFAYGIDAFWRANQSIENLDFWISYSWLQSEREYLNYPKAVMPEFSTEHNFSLVTKLWMPKLKSQLGASYNFTSGRPFENPNTEGFLNEQSKSFHNISLSWAYLISQQKILFGSVSNPLNIKNEFGYRYADSRNIDGIYPGEVIRPNADQFFFLGFFVTISPDKTENQLDQL